MRLERQIAILDTFRQLPPQTLTRKALGEYLATQRAALKVPKSFGVDDLIGLLSENDVLRVAEITSQEYGNKSRYAFGAISPLQVACSFYKGSFLSHATALYLHGLAPLDIIFVNHEQSLKNSTSRLTQAGLNNAFRNSQRQSTYVFRYGTHTITFLNGKNTGGAGLTEMQAPGGERLTTTSLERTLIDIVVRPQYAGGIPNVVSAFRQAKDRVSVTELAHLLAKMSYVYPYHQSLGFLLQRVGTSEQDLQPLKERGLRYKFFLDYEMDQPAYDPVWRIHFPSDLPEA